MIHIVEMPILKVRYVNNTDISGIDKEKQYPVIATVTKHLDDKADPKKKRQHDQIVIIDDNGTWRELYPSHCKFFMMAGIDKM